MRTLPYIALATAALCAHACGGTPHTPAPEPERAEPEVSGPLAIEMRLPPLETAAPLEFSYHIEGNGPLPNPVLAQLPSDWAGRDAFLDDIYGVHAYDPDGTELATTVDADGRLEIFHEPPTDYVSLEYRVAPTRRLLTEASRFYALRSADRFYAPGHALFAQPLNVGVPADEPISLSVSRYGIPVRSTLADTTPVTMTTLVNASFYAGDLDHSEFCRDQRCVHIAMEPSLRLPGWQLAADTLDIIDAQADMLGEALTSHTTVIVLRRDDNANTLTGNGREGGFVLELGYHVDAVTDDLAELIAHENFHRLNGHYLTFDPADEFATLWFREGVTDYVAHRTAVEAGVIPETNFFQQIGTALTMYRDNPVAETADATAMQAAFWTDRDYRRLPYDKGTLLALLIDLDLRRQGQPGIEDFLRYLRSSANAPLTNALLREALEAYSGRSWETFFDEYVLGTTWLPVFDELRSIGLEVVERLEPAPYFGFRTNMTADGAWYISDVDSRSPAAIAGLSPGMPLVDEPTIPEGLYAHATLRVQTHYGVVDVSVPASTGQRRVYAIRALDHEDYRDHFGWLDE